MSGSNLSVAIIGTRGIPNNYGGYEAFAEKFGIMMVERGHHVTVFNSSLHPYKERQFNGVEITRCNDPEKTLGTAGQFIYDFNCIMQCRQRNFDIILQLGYTSSSVWSFLFPPKAIIITNMDGLEWQRSKYSPPVQLFLKHAEKWAAKNSNALVADNPAIQSYLLEKYHIKSTCIAYGTEVFSKPNEESIKEFDIQAYSYNLIVARLEPENNIEVIIKGHLAVNTTTSLLIVGDVKNSFAKRLKAQYASPKIIFTSGIYNAEKLNQLRWYSNLYFHGHSVGGTNPSLLEAMGCSVLICAHNNQFNRNVLGNDAFYFETEKDIAGLLINNPQKSAYKSFIDNNLKKVKELYTWTKITDEYEELFLNQVRK